MPGVPLATGIYDAAPLRIRLHTPLIRKLIDELHQWTATEKHQAALLVRPRLAVLLGRGFLAKAPAAPASLILSVSHANSGIFQFRPCSFPLAIT